MNGDPPHLVRFLQSHVLPGLAAVGGFVDAIAVRHRVARIAFPSAHPDDIAIRRSDADVANGDRRLLVELVLEADAVIDSLHEAAGRGRYPVGTRICLEDRDGGDAPA